MPDFVKDAFKQGYDLWLLGGWAMFPLAANAFILYAKAAQIRMELKRKGYQRFESHSKEQSVTDQAAIASAYLSERGIEVPGEAAIEDMEYAFDELRAVEIPPVDRDLRFMKVAMSAAPLWGLLGTVTGMLATFDGLARGGGSDKTMNMVAGGISEALITTQTGLMIALPGYFFYYYLSGSRDKFEAFLARMESAFTQTTLHAKA